MTPINEGTLSGGAGKDVVLGTALWGWGVDRKEAYKILDEYTASGGRLIDVATNYPINKKVSDFGLALEFIADWQTSRNFWQLKVILKLGSINNYGTSEFDLSSARVLKIVDHANSLLKNTLYCASVHWDNRGNNEEDLSGIKSTAQALNLLYDYGYRIGLSGIENPAAYRRFLKICTPNLIIQVKENLLSDQARCRYQEHFPDANYIAYGINLGGLKREKGTTESSLSLRGLNYSEDVRLAIEGYLKNNELIPSPSNFADFALLYTYCNKDLNGVIIGPRNVGQLSQSYEYWRRLCSIRPEYDVELIKSQALRGTIV